MREPFLGKRLKKELEKYSDYIDDWYIEDDYYGTECGEDNIYSVWIHFKTGYFDPINESSIVHEHNQNDALRKFRDYMKVIKERGF